MATRAAGKVISLELDPIDRSATRASDSWMRAGASAWTCALLLSSCQGSGLQMDESTQLEEPATTVHTPTLQGVAELATENVAPPAAQPNSPTRAPRLLLDARRRELTLELAREVGWNLYESRFHYLATPVSDPWLVEDAKLRLDATRHTLQREFGSALEPSNRRKNLVRIYPTESDYIAAGGPRGSTGFWSKSDTTLVVFDAGTTEDRAAKTWGALQHVVVHEFLDESIGIEAAPPWLLFGLGGYFERLNYVVEGAHAGELRAGDEGRRWSELREVTAAEGPPPLRRLLAFNREEFRGVNEFGSGPWRNLIFATSFVAFLREEQEGAHAQLLADFLRRLASGSRAGTDPATLLPESELEPLESAWRDWIALRIGREL